MSAHPDPAAIIRQRLRLTPVPGLSGISLYAAHSGSGLRQLIEASGSQGAPYWAYQWAGGLALAHHFAAQPEAVAGKRMLDLGAGGGLVAIAAAKAGAAHVTASEIDAFGIAALKLNVAANDVQVDILPGDLLDGPPPTDINLIAVGDLFYEAGLARRTTAFLDRCAAAGIEIIIGDPGRDTLPLDRLLPIAEYGVADVGDMRDAAKRRGMVFGFRAVPAG